MFSLETFLKPFALTILKQLQFLCDILTPRIRYSSYSCSVTEKTDVMVLAPVMVLAYKSRGPKGLQLEVGARRAPRLLVFHISELHLHIYHIFNWKLHIAGPTYHKHFQEKYPVEYHRGDC